MLLVNSKFTARIFKTYFSTILHPPRVVYPGINIEAYNDPLQHDLESVGDVLSYVICNCECFCLSLTNSYIQVQDSPYASLAKPIREKEECGACHQSVRASPLALDVARQGPWPR